MSRHDHFRQWLAEQAAVHSSTKSDLPAYQHRSRRARIRSAEPFEQAVPRIHSAVPAKSIRTSARSFSPAPAPVRHDPARQSALSRGNRLRRSRSWAWQLLKRYPFLVLSLFWLVLIGLSGWAILRLLDPLFSSSERPPAPVVSAPSTEPPVAEPDSIPLPAPDITASLPPSAPQESSLASLGAIVLGAMLGSLLVSSYLRRF